MVKPIVLPAQYCFCQRAAGSHGFRQDSPSTTWRPSACKAGSLLQNYSPPLLVEVWKFSILNCMGREYTVFFLTPGTRLSCSLWIILCSPSSYDGTRGRTPAHSFSPGAENKFQSKRHISICGWGQRGKGMEQQM